MSIQPEHAQTIWAFSAEVFQECARIFRVHEELTIAVGSGVFGASVGAWAQWTRMVGPYRMLEKLFSRETKRVSQLLEVMKQWSAEPVIVSSEELTPDRTVEHLHPKKHTKGHSTLRKRMWRKFRPGPPPASAPAPAS